MIAAGYLLKHVADPADSWQHNGFGLANDPDLLQNLAAQNDVDLTGAELFFYAAYERELESDGWTFDPAKWQPRTPDETSSVPDDVLVPEPSRLVLVGYDVVAVEYGDLHSPLSCNSMAAEIPVNASCLFDTFEDAKAAIDEGRSGCGCEPGADTIFAVHRVLDPART